MSVRRAEVFEIVLEVEPAIAANLDAYAKADGREPAAILLAVLERVMARDLFASILSDEDPDALTGCADDQTFAAVTVDKLASLLVCPSCGGRKGYYSAHCRACFLAAKAAVAMPVYEYRCVDCGGPRSLGSAARCSACYAIHAAARKVAKAATPAAAGRCRTCDGPCGIGSKQCRPCYEAGVQAKRDEKAISAPVSAPTPPAPPVPAAPPERPTAPALPAKPREIRSDQEFGSDPRVRPQRPFLQPAPPPAPIAEEPDNHRAVVRQAERVVIRAQGFKAAPDPFAKKERPKAKVAATFSPEFLAKLQRVRDGAGIVEVRPLRAAEPSGHSTGSSLSDIT